MSDIRPLRKFYAFGTLPARPEHLDRVRTTLRAHGVLQKKRLAQATRLSLNQALCAIDALIAAGEVTYEEADRQFRLIRTAP